MTTSAAVSSYRPDDSWSCTRDHRTTPCGDCDGCRAVQQENRTTASAHPANCVGSYEDEPHIQDGGCMCDCPACTSGDHVQRCICPDCPGNPECGDHDDR